MEEGEAASRRINTPLGATPRAQRCDDSHPFVFCHLFITALWATPANNLVLHVRFLSALTSHISVADMTWGESDQLFIVIY